MRRKKIVIVTGIAAVLFFALFTYESPTRMENTSVSGRYFGQQIWSGDILVTGDVDIFGDLIVLPGTTVKFIVGDDRHRGDEVPADGFNDKDPTRLRSYTTTHAGLFVLGVFDARGTDEQPIVFTSAATTPHLADWESIVFRGNGSVVDNIIVEYTRNGLNPIGKQPESVIQNTISRHVLWGAISSANSNIKIINNHLSDAGHEGIDLKFDGVQEVSGNLIEDCHTGIASMAGSQIIANNTIKNCGDGVFISSLSKAISTNNTFTPALSDSTRVWRYGDYTIPVFDYPELE